MTTNTYDLNPTLAEHRTNAIRPSWVGGHEGCDLEIVTHLLLAEGQQVTRLDTGDGYVHVIVDPSWSEIKDVLVRYMHCKIHDVEWTLDYLHVVDE